MRDSSQGSIRLLSDFNNLDKYSYELIFKLNYNKLCYFANKIIKDKDVSQDIVQDIFVKLWEMDKSFDSFDKISSYLYVSVKNRCYNHINKEKLILNATNNKFINIESDDLLEQILSAEVLSVISLAISTLPKECEKVMKYVLKGYSSVEIALIMNLAPSSIRAQKARGVKLLRTKLNDEMFILIQIILIV